MKDAALINAFWKGHFFNRYFLGFFDVSLAAVDNSIGACTDFLPIFVVAEICEGS